MTQTSEQLQFQWTDSKVADELKEFFSHFKPSAKEVSGDFYTDKILEACVNKTVLEISIGHLTPEILNELNKRSNKEIKKIFIKAIFRRLAQIKPYYDAVAFCNRIKGVKPIP